MAIREALWDCQYCGTTGILGRNKSCPNCGRSRPEGTKFYLPEDADEVRDEKLKEQAKRGPDWICEFCGSSNPADVSVCGSCGHPREDTSPEQKITDYELGAAPKAGDMAPPPEPQPAETSAMAKKALPIAAIAIIAVVLCVVGVIAFAVLGRKDVEAKVDGFSWQRAVQIEAFRTVTEEDWQVPQGGRLLSQRQEIHHYDQILDHYETRERQVQEQVQTGVRTYVCGQRDLGNGFFEDVECTEPVYETQSRTETYQEPIYISQPVYQTLFVFEIDKWDYDRTEEASGSDHSPYWPRADLADGYREGEREETYVVYFSSDGETYSLELPYDEWRTFEMGQQVKLKLDAFGKLSEVER